MHIEIEEFDCVYDMFLIEKMVGKYYIYQTI